MTRTPRTQTQQRWAAFGFGGAKRWAAASSEEAALLSRLFIPETFLDSQTDTSRPLTPVQQLQLAVLDNAITLIRKPHYVKKFASRLARDEAIEWLLSDDESGPFAFLVICQHLEIHPSRLQRWTRQQKAVYATTKRQRTHRYRGVQCDPRTNHWGAHIGKKNEYLGTYLTEEEAARAYDTEAFARYGDLRRLNFPEEWQTRAHRETT